MHSRDMDGAAMKSYRSLIAIVAVVAFAAAVMVFVRDGPNTPLEEGTLHAPGQGQRLSTAVGAPAKPDLDPVFPLVVGGPSVSPILAVSGLGTGASEPSSVPDPDEEIAMAAAPAPGSEPGVGANEAVSGGCPRGSARAEEQTSGGNGRPGRRNAPACPHDSTRAGGGSRRDADTSMRGSGG